MPAGDDALLPGKLGAVFDLRTQLFRRVVHMAEPHRNEKAGGRALVADLPRGALVLADLGHFGFAWFDDLTDAGHYWVSRLHAKTSTVRLHAFYERGETFDGLWVWLGARNADKAKHAVRLVQFRHGGVLYRYLTNVRDPRRLPMREIARLYARRWDIESTFRLVKRELKLHLLWSAKLGVVLRQIWAVLTIAQVVQALRLEIAAAGIDPFEVSLPLLAEELPLLLARGEDPVAVFVADDRRLGFIRPSTRTVVHAPAIPADALAPPSPDLVLLRPPRHARRKCGPRAA